MDDRTLLIATIQAAVTIEMSDVTEVSMSAFLRDRDRLVELICAHGDQLQYGGKHCRDVHAALTRTLAHLAHNPGGVTWCGLHWCAGSGHRGTADTMPCAAEIARMRSEAA